MKRSSKANNTTQAINQEWFRTLYMEAWKQYCHEDNLFQSRNTLYTGLQAVLITLLTGVTPSLISLEPITIGTFKIAIGVTVLGGIAIILAIFGILFARNWERVTQASRAYLSLRLSSARIIEKYNGLEEFGIAEIEHRWWDWSNKNKKRIMENPATWFPSGFSDEAGNQLEIRPRPASGGFDAHLGIIGLIRTIWYVVCFVSIIPLLYTLILIFRGLISIK